MKRAQIVGPKRPLVLEEAPVPDPPRNGAVIKTQFSGICHSDLNQWHDEISEGDTVYKFSDHPAYNFPIVPGHEIGGVVHSLGPGTQSDELKIGDRVVAYPWIGCSNCGYCYNDCTSLCTKRYFGLGIGAPGGYSNFVSVSDKKFLVKIPDDLPMEVACMLPCSGLTTYNAVSVIQPALERTVSFKGHASLLIVGAGGLGLWCIQIAKHVLPSTVKIVVADISERNLENAKKSGCDDVAYWDRNGEEDDVVEMTKTKAVDGSFDGVIDLVNSTVTMHRAIKVTNKGSTIIMIGLYGGRGSIALPQMVREMRTIRGSLTGTLGQLRQLVKLASTEKLVAPPMEFFPLERAYDGMCACKDGKIRGRGIITFD